MTQDRIRGLSPTGWAVAIIAVSFLARLWFIASGQLDLVQDEAQYWDWTRRLQLSYYSKGPLIAWIIAFWTNVFGDTELGVRFGALLHSTLTQILLYWGLAVLWQRPRAALATLAVANTAPLFLASGLLMTTDNPLMLCWSAALFALWAAGEGRGGRVPWLVLAAAMTLGILAKYMMLAFVGVAVLYGIALHRQGLLARSFWPRLGLALSAGTALGLAPILIWNAANDFVGFRHVATQAGLEGSRAKTFLRLDKFPEFIGGQIGLATPWWFAFLLVGAWRALRQSMGRGAAYGLEQSQALLLSAGFWPLFGFFVLWSFHTKIEANWPAMAYVSGLPLAGFALEALAGKDSVRARRIVGTCLALGAVVFLALHLLNQIPVPGKLNPAGRLMGWHDLGKKIHELRETRFADPGEVFFFSDSYDMTAALAFYIPGQPVTYSVNAGRRMSQYDLWPGPQGRAGENAIYVRKRRRGEVQPEVAALFSRVERIYYPTRHRDREGRKFTIYLCYGYTGDWPMRTKGF